MTEYRLVLEYVWEGFCSVEIEPSPNVQNQLVGVPEERSWNETTRGSSPVFGFAVKSAFSGPPGAGVGVGDGVGVGVGVGEAVGVGVGVDVGVGEMVGVGVGAGLPDTVI